MQRVIGTALAVAVLVSIGGSGPARADGSHGGPYMQQPGWGMGQGGGYGMMGPGSGYGYGMRGQGYGYGMMGPGSGRGMMNPGSGYGMMGPGSGRGMMNPGSGYGMMGPGSGRGAMGPSGNTQIDGNDDGVISASEAARHFEAVFAALDADQDGAVTREEFVAMPLGAGPQMAGRGGDMKPWRERKEARFKAMDADSDGKVTQPEFLAYGKSRFEAADGDKDGKVTVWEFRSQRQF